MHYFPVFVDLHDQPVLVVGAGSVAERKIRMLMQAGAKVRVVARQLSEQVEVWQRRSDLDWLESEYDSSQLEGHRLVFAATNDEKLNRRVFNDAEAANVLANVVDQQAYCRFISPAVVDRSPVQVAISTAGTSPVLARIIKSWIDAMLPSGLGRVAEAAGKLRPSIARRLSFAARRSFWERLLTPQAIDRWSTSSSAQIGREMADEIEHEVSRGAESGRRIASGRNGKVFLVGAGPGRVDLLTLRAAEILRSADVVLYDRLVSEEILDRVRRDADRVYVGKRAGNHHRTQQQTNQLLVEWARRGKTVVRLKGGDPFMFGRGGEELEVLRAQGIDYEVVPGVTAATGCAAYAGIPLTHRDHSKAVTFITGHLVTGQIDWARVAGEDRTLVVYMGVKQATNIQKALLSAGVAADLPAALVEDGTLDSQRVTQGSVGELCRLAASARDGVPGLLVIGQVAALGSNLSWFESIEEIRSAA